MSQKRNCRGCCSDNIGEGKGKGQEVDRHEETALLLLLLAPQVPEMCELAQLPGTALNRRSCSASQRGQSTERAVCCQPPGIPSLSLDNPSRR